MTTFKNEFSWSVSRDAAFRKCQRMYYYQYYGSWGGRNDPKPIELGMKAGLPLLSPDGKYLFFTAGERGKNDIYWVDARIIEELKPDEL